MVWHCLLDLVSAISRLWFAWDMSLYKFVLIDWLIGVAGVKVGCVHLCRLAGKTVLSPEWPLAFENDWDDLFTRAISFKILTTAYIFTFRSCNGSTDAIKTQEERTNEKEPFEARLTWQCATAMSTILKSSALFLVARLPPTVYNEWTRYKLQNGAIPLT